MTALLAATAGFAQQPSTGKAISPEQRATIESVVKAYLLKNPAVVRDALQALQVAGGIIGASAQHQAPPMTLERG